MKRIFCLTALSAILFVQPGCGSDSKSNSDVLDDAKASQDQTLPDEDLLSQDLALDTLPSDGVAKDVLVQDLTQPDTAQPDLSPADLAQPDLATPDLAVPDIEPEDVQPDLGPDLPAELKSAGESCVEFDECADGMSCISGQYTKAHCNPMCTTNQDCIDAAPASSGQCMAIGGYQVCVWYCGFMGGNKPCPGDLECDGATCG